jgi:hypothetical protein
LIHIAEVAISSTWKTGGPIPAGLLGAGQLSNNKNSAVQNF